MVLREVGANRTEDGSTGRRNCDAVVEWQVDSLAVDPTTNTTELKNIVNRLILSVSGTYLRYTSRASHEFDTVLAGRLKVSIFKSLGSLQLSISAFAPQTTHFSLLI